MLLSITETAERLACSASNVRNLIDRGLLAVVPTGANGKGLRVPLEEIERFIEDRKHFRGKDANQFPDKCNPVKLKHLL